MGVKCVGNKSKQKCGDGVCVGGGTCQGMLIFAGEPLIMWVTCHSFWPSCQCGCLWVHHLSLSTSLFLLSDTMEHSLLSHLLEKALGCRPKTNLCEAKARVNAQQGAGTGSF